MEDVPADLADKATKIAKRFSRELCGIDFMLDLKTNDYIFLEVNATPQLVSGVFIDRKLAAIAKAITAQEEG
jgi:D-alanine-D-alanine ligase-like ATP-grasp enzyme